MPTDSAKKPLPLVVIRSLLVLLFVIWSNAFTAIKHLREILSPGELVLARFFPVAIFCFLYIIFKEDRRKESLEILRHSPLRLLSMGLFGVAGYNYFLYLGQGEIKPGAAALLTTLSPLFTLVLAIIFLKEKVPLRRALGIILAFAGLYVVINWGRVGRGRMTGISHAEIRYASITALAPLCWTFYTIIGKDLVKKWSPMTVTFLTIVFGFLPFIPTSSSRLIQILPHMGISHWIAIFHLTALCTLVGFWIWITALQHLPATSVASFIYLNPPFAALFGWLIFGEEITAIFLFGSAVVIFGLFLTQTGKVTKLRT